VPFEQAHAAEPQQTLGKFVLRGLLQTQSATRGENNGAHIKA
jgi:hypothetical protein